MRIEYFDLPNEGEVTVEMAWPMQPLSFNWNGQNDTVRVYYSVLKDFKLTKIKFFCVKSEQELPATFPGKYTGTCQAEYFDERDDSAIHIFIEIPVNKPDKPKIINQKNKQPLPRGKKKARRK